MTAESRLPGALFCVGRLEAGREEMLLEVNLTWLWEPNAPPSPEEVA